MSTHLESPVVQAFINIVNSIGNFEKNPHIALALSGGKDSMALLNLLDFWLRQVNGKLTCLIVDHKLRASSTKDCQALQNYLDRCSLNSVILSTDLGAKQKNIQASARDYRYQLLEDYCAKHHILHLFLGHHSQDQWETFQIRKEKKSGDLGLACMPLVRYSKKIRFIRPLLSFTPEAVHPFSGDFIIEDPSNKQLNYRRNQIRHKQTMVASHLNKDLDYIERAQKKRFLFEKDCQFQMAKIIRQHNSGCLEIDKAKFFKLAHDHQLIILKNVLNYVGGKQFHIKQTELKSCLRKLIENLSTTLNHCYLYNRQNNIIVTKEHKEDYNFSSPQANYWFEIVIKDSTNDQFILKPLYEANKTLMNYVKKRYAYLPKRGIQNIPVFFNIDCQQLLPHFIEYDANDDFCKKNAFFYYAPSFLLGFHQKIW